MDAAHHHQQAISYGRGMRLLMVDTIEKELSALNRRIHRALEEFLIQGSIQLELAATSTERMIVATAKTHLDALNSVATSQKTTLSTIQRQLIDHLPHADARYNSASRNLAPSCLAGTRVALLRLILEWVESTDPDKPWIFWLCGLAGTGKSTIAQTIAENLAGSGKLGASFFFSRDTAECSNGLLLFSTIARQLAFSYPELGLRIGEVLEANRDAGKLVAKEQLRALVIEPLSRLQDAPGPMAIVIDALDECADPKQAQEILNLLATEVYQLPFRIPILITSRSEMYISSKFESPCLKPISVPFLLHEIEEQVVSADIELFLRHKLGLIAQDMGMEGTWPDDDDVDALRDKARGLFIHAATAVKFIGDEYYADPEGQLDAILTESVNSSGEASPFADMDVLYSRVLIGSLPPGHRRAELIDRFQKVVGSIVLLLDPLPLTPLAILLGLKSSAVSAALSRLHSVIVVPTSMDQPIHIIHPSFHDYLVDPRRCGDERFRVDPTLHHEQLALRCMELMLSELDHSTLFQTDPSRVLIDKDVTSHLRYACKYWAHHLSRAPLPTPNSSILLVFQQFVSDKLLHWLEMARILGILNTVLASFSVAKSWYSAISEDDETYSYLHVVRQHKVVSALHRIICQPSNVSPYPMPVPRPRVRQIGERWYKHVVIYQPRVVDPPEIQR